MARLNKVFRLALIVGYFILISPTLWAIDGSEVSNSFLSDEEQAWLKEHPVIRMGIDTNFGPYSFLGDDGKLEGVVPDILIHIEQRLGLKIEFVTDLDWLELMSGLRNKDLDVVATVAYLPERESFVEFSEIYIPTPLVVMTRNDAPQIESLQELLKLRTVLVEGYSSSKQVKEMLPNLQADYVSKPVAGLRALSTSGADAYVGNLGVNTFLATKHGIANLKVNAAFDMEQNGQRFGVRKDWPQLAKLLDKTLNEIPDNEKYKIFDAWLPIQAGEIRRLSNPSLLVRSLPWLLAIGFAIFLAYLIQWFWNRQLKQELVRRKAEIERAQAVAHMADWSYDVKNNSIEWSLELFRIVGRVQQKIAPEVIIDWVHEEDREACKAYFLRFATSADNKRVPKFTARISRPNGEVRWVEITSAVVYDDKNRVRKYFGTALDVTERKLFEEKIRHLAFYDDLTDLPNRRLLLDRLAIATLSSARNRRHGALIMLDLDGFKDINDTQGHAVGDILLQEVAQRVKKVVREHDTVSRMGGDEFLVLVEELNADIKTAAIMAETVAEKVRLSLESPYYLGQDRSPYLCSVSIGVTLFIGQNPAADVLLKQVDVALYQAKNSGRSVTRFFNPDMQVTIDARMQLQQALRQSLSNNELTLYFQPQVNKEGMRIGAEALLRWQRANGEFISPAQFIPVAEESGLILPIGAWVIKSACEQLLRWSKQASTKQLVLAVNVSARQFHQPDFVRHVADNITMFGVQASLLKLELTESVVLVNVEETVERMRQLKALGVSFSLDDFGTGYSSLSYLKQLPIDQVKIDRSFIRELTTSSGDVAIVKAIIAMCDALGVNVIAEGVETEEQAKLLHEFGCSFHQGYFYGHPLPVEEWADG